MDLDDYKVLRTEERINGVIDGLLVRRVRHRQHLRFHRHQSLLSSSRSKGNTHLDTAHTLLTDEINGDREESPDIVSVNLELETPRRSSSIHGDLIDTPLERSVLKVDAVGSDRGVFGNDGGRVGRKWNGDEEGVE